MIVYIYTFPNGKKYSEEHKKNIGLGVKGEKNGNVW